MLPLERFVAQACGGECICVARRRIAPPTDESLVLSAFPPKKISALLRLSSSTPFVPPHRARTFPFLSVTLAPLTPHCLRPHYDHAMRCNDAVLPRKMTPLLWRSVVQDGRILRTTVRLGKDKIGQLCFRFEWLVFLKLRHPSTCSAAEKSQVVCISLLECSCGILPLLGLSFLRGARTLTPHFPSRVPCH